MFAVRRSTKLGRFLCVNSIYPLVIILILFAVGGLISLNLSLKDAESVSKFGAARDDKYLTSTFTTGFNGGLGNKLYEIISIVGIARSLKRIPYYDANDTQIVKIFEGRIWNLFPKLEEQFQNISDVVNETVVCFHSAACCKYEDPINLENRTDEYLKLDGSYFQSFKYFHEIRDSVREWLIPPQDIMERAAARIPKTCSGKLGVCVHVRRGDYLTSKVHQPSLSTASFTFNTTMNLIDDYSEDEEVCSMVFGNDAKWTKELFKDHKQVLVIEGTKPEEDFALSRQFCDVFLITAPASTFGFWLAYLAKPGAQVYYKSITNFTQGVFKQINAEDFFLPDWIGV